MIYLDYIENLNKPTDSSVKHKELFTMVILVRNYGSYVFYVVSPLFRWLVIIYC